MDKCRQTHSAPTWAQTAPAALSCFHSLGWAGWRTTHPHSRPQLPWSTVATFPSSHPWRNPPDFLSLPPACQVIRTDHSRHLLTHWHTHAGLPVLHRSQTGSDPGPTCGWHLVSLSDHWHPGIWVPWPMVQPVSKFTLFSFHIWLGLSWICLNTCSTEALRLQLSLLLKGDGRHSKQTLAWCRQPFHEVFMLSLQPGVLQICQKTQWLGIVNNLQWYLN